MKWLDAALVSTIVPVLLACGLFSPYSSGRIPASGEISPSAVREGRCIDMGVSLSGRGEVSPILMLTKFGNKCTEAARFDMTRVHVEAYFADHHESLYVDDPRNEVVPLHLETRTMGTERFRLGPMSDRRPSRVCVHVEEVIGAPVQPICFIANPGDASWGVVQ